MTDYISREEILDTLDECIEMYADNQKPQTNADRIRAMTDEELAEFLERIRVLCGNDFCGMACPLYHVCYSRANEPAEVLDWLRQEATDDSD